MPMVSIANAVRKHILKQVWLASVLYAVAALSLLVVARVYARERLKRRGAYRVTLTLWCYVVHLLCKSSKYKLN